MSPTVYIETTIVSYLTARPSRDLLLVAQQNSTREWWDTRRSRFDVLTSELTILEASDGDPSAAADRLNALATLPVLQVTPSATDLADALLRAGAIPDVASRDALHVGLCATNGITYLLTWNFRHLANASLRDKINEVCLAHGYKPPVICTPDELFED